MQTIKILKDTRCDGERVRAGEVIDAPGKDARFLIAIGKAEEAEKPKKRPRKPVDKAIDPETLETR